jgi:hypothetical protein
MEFNIIKNDDDASLCFLCLDKVDYYIKYNCDCHNYLHINCIDNQIFSNCFICKKKINCIITTQLNLDDNNLLIIFNNFELLYYIHNISNMYTHIDIIFKFLRNNKYLIIYFLLLFIIILSIIILNIIYNLLQFLQFFFIKIYNIAN